MRSQDQQRFLQDLSWAEDVLVSSEDKPDLDQWLQQQPSAAEGIKNVVTSYLDAHEPSSMAQPWPGVQLDPVPNPNQWTDNPFTRRDIDTDGDGFPDWVEWEEANRRGVPWPDVINNPNEYPDPYADPDGDGYTTLEEVQVGTNPYDPNSHPSRRPAPSTDTDGDGWPDADEIKRGTDPSNPNEFPYQLPYNQDTDGDSVPDWKEIESGTDPYSPESRPEAEPEEQPEDSQWPGGPPVPGLKEVEFPTREVERQPLPELDRLLQPWEEQVVQRWQQAIRELKSVLADKFPFGIVLALSRVSVSREGAQCTFDVPLGPVRATISPCETPFFQTAESFRPILAGLLWLSFVLLMVRRGLDVQG
ncbi:hypothetical protein [Thermus caldifontis]|uniref:hypothetical protein n=1 Tax=Thermus caldifontis TaxID=1930763 RepID=UPI0013B399F3|nr:hypothetical protein [Thermus caldifontis]